MSLIYNSALRICHRYTAYSRFQVYACMNKRLTLCKAQPRFIHVSSVHCKKKVAKVPSSKKNTASAIDKLLDELSDDEAEKKEVKQATEELPVSKFSRLK